jgi:hypothetical protein
MRKKMMPGNEIGRQARFRIFIPIWLYFLLKNVSISM